MLCFQNQCCFHIQNKFQQQLVVQIYHFSENKSLTLSNFSIMQHLFLICDYNIVKRIMQNITFCVKSCVLGKQKSDAFPNNSLLMINFVRRNIVRKSII